MDRSVDLGTLLAALPGEAFGDWSSVVVTGLAIDSRRVTPGDLFVALPGEHVDGGRFVEAALRRGASAVVVGRGTQLPERAAGLRLADPRQALACVAERFYDHPSRRLRVHGVTGTNGKTTTAYMISQVLAAAGNRVGYWTTNEVNTGVHRFRPVLTTPEAPDLQRFLRQVCDVGGSDACIEVSSHAVVQRRIAGLRFHCGVVTNVTPDHLDFHGDFAAYLAAKRGFVLGLEPPAVCFYNLDDAGARAAVAGATVALLTYGFAPEADIRGLDPVDTVAGATCRVRLSTALQAALPAGRQAEPTFVLELPVPGRHNLLNALAATGVALLAAVPVETLRTALAGFHPASRRFGVQTVGSYTVIDDVAMNEASYDAVFATLAATCGGGVVVVNALRGHRGPDVNARIAEVLARWDRRLRFAPVIVSESRKALRRYPVDYSVLPEERRAFAGAADRAGLPYQLHEELDDALRAAIERLRPGDALALLGTFGMDEGVELAVRRLCELAGLDPPSIEARPDQSFG